MAYTPWHDFASGETLTASTMDALVANLQALFPVGSYMFIAKAATTSETNVGGVWLECNAVSVLRATWPDLNTLLSGLGYPFGSVDGTHFTLPDAQARSLVSMASGGHADVNGLADSDGITKNSRTPKGLVSSTVSGTTSSVSVPGTGLTVTTTSTATSGGAVAGFAVSGAQAIGGSATAAAGTFSGSGSGSVPGNYLVGGTLFIKAVA